MKAIVSRKCGSAARATFGEVDLPSLADGEVEVKIEYSTLNYKDALAMTKGIGIVKSWPMVLGIDLAGTVVACSSSTKEWSVGEQVVVTGWGLGECRWGGLAEYCHIPSECLLKAPAKFDTRDCMSFGTAGVTAALAVQALRDHSLQPNDGDVLITGASGGVGSIAIVLLSRLGYRVFASTGKLDQYAYLQRLGAYAVVPRTELCDPGPALQSERWSAVIDTVGSHTLANASAATKWNGMVAACGLAQGPKLMGTVMPFILRAVTLRGINSVYVENSVRAQVWELLQTHIDRSVLSEIVTTVGLSEALALAPRILDGRVRGRIVVDVSC